MCAQWSERRKSADWRRPSEASRLPARDVTLAYLLATAELSGPCLLAGGHFRRWLDKVAARYVCGWLLVAADQTGGCRQLFSNVVSESKRCSHTKLTLITSSRIGFGFWLFFCAGIFLFFLFFFVETITTVSLLTFYSNKLVALLILMACCNPISGDLSSFLMARHHISASYGPLQTRTHTRCHPTRHNEHSSAAPPLCPAPASVWLYVKWYILSYWSFLVESQAGLSGPARPVCLLKGHTVRAVCLCQASVFCVIQGSLWLSGHCGPLPLPCALLPSEAKQLIKM